MENIEYIKKILTSQFELELFDAALYCLNDTTNRLRYNNFAYSIRELSRHFLNNLSPESNVKECSWFKVETENGKPTRSQRIIYAIQGGIGNEILEEWGFDIHELHETIKSVKNTIDALSKYTHINADVFNLNDFEIEQNSKTVLKEFSLFVKTIENYKERIKSFLDDHIEEHMLSSLLSTYFENVDCLAPHYTLNDSELLNYHISEITAQEIVVSVFGSLNVTLEYGSRQERLDGDGLDLEEWFPFETKIMA